MSDNGGKSKTKAAKTGKKRALGEATDESGELKRMSNKLDSFISKFNAAHGAMAADLEQTNKTMAKHSTMINQLKDDMTKLMDQVARLAQDEGSQRLQVPASRRWAGCGLSALAQSFPLTPLPPLQQPPDRP